MLAHLANGYYERECNQMAERLNRGADAIEKLMSGEITSVKCVFEDDKPSNQWEQFWINFFKARDAQGK